MSANTASVCEIRQFQFYLWVQASLASVIYPADAVERICSSLLSWEEEGGGAASASKTFICEVVVSRLSGKRWQWHC